MKRELEIEDIAQLRKDVYRSLIKEGWDAPEAAGMASDLEDLLAGVMGLRPVLPRPRPTPPTSAEELALTLGLPLRRAGSPPNLSQQVDELRNDLDELRVAHAATDSLTDRIVASIAGIKADTDRWAARIAETEHRLDTLNATISEMNDSLSLVISEMNTLSEMNTPTPTPTPAPTPPPGFIRIGEKVINTALIRYIDRNDEDEVTVYFVGDTHSIISFEYEEAVTLWQHMMGQGEG